MHRILDEAQVMSSKPPGSVSIEIPCHQELSAMESASRQKAIMECTGQVIPRLPN
jgi:hypothetical protein